jgi:predicted NBD/HSP70 family sugar kinase
MADLKTGILATSQHPLETTDFDTVVDAIVSVVVQLTVSLGDRADRLACVGIAVSGDVNSRAGVVRASALMGWTDRPLGSVLGERLAIRVVVENDVRALTIGEHWFGVGLGTASFAIVTIGRGIGSGIHVNGEVVEGAYGVAGEIGHLPLASPDKICSCGRRGCVEAVASSAAIVAAASEGRTGAPLSISDVVELAHQGDPLAVRAFQDAANVVGTAIATLVNLTGPELVIIGGEAVSNFDLFDESLRSAFAAHTFGSAANGRIVIRPHTFEDWAGASAAGIRAIVTQHRR